MSSKSPENDQNRYRRQLGVLEELGQKTLEDSSVAVVGLGGLGSPAATYLALAGLGKLVLADHDKVELSNLNRQFLHWNEDLNRRKSESAREKLKKLNPEIAVETFEGKLTSDNMENLPATDLIVGSVDNFETRYLLNELAVKREIPYVHGAVEGFSGQLTTIVPDESPCLRCIFPESPPEKTGMPILGTTAGLIGTLMANETIKYLSGRGSLISGELLLADLTSNEFDLVKYQKNPDCPICGP
ncbi:HesA/MoeB/ThiF family protein [Candidatus Bipolaricaulota bacterium]|nr:HesA/MoeB/ThiF family protein [Candidatus Bipolaricaulota bacterium]